MYVSMYIFSLWNQQIFKEKIYHKVLHQGLRADGAQNILLNYEAQQLWTPSLTFINTEKQEKTILDNRTMITIKRLGNYEQSNDDSIKNQYLYSGSDNPMTMSHIYSTHWLCEYKMMSYPFDTQVTSWFYNFVTRIKGI